MTQPGGLGIALLMLLELVWELMLSTPRIMPGQRSEIVGPAKGCSEGRNGVFSWTPFVPWFAVTTTFALR